MSLDLKKRKDQEYEMQLFGFNSRAVCATLHRIIGEKIQMCCKKLSESLERIYNPDENIALTIQYDEKILVKAYLSYSQHHTNIMKRCVKKLVAVPGNVLLEEDRHQMNKYSQEEYQYIENHLRHLQIRAKKATMLRAAMEEELRLLAEFEPYENEVDMASIVIENGSMHPGVDNNTTQCVKNCRVLEDTIKKSSPKSFANVYTADIYNLRVYE